MQASNNRFGRFYWHVSWCDSRRPVFLAIAPLVLAFSVCLPGCGSTSSATSQGPLTPSPPPAGSALSVFVNPVVLGVGETGQASAGLRPSDTEVTAQTSWQSLNPTSATVSSTGLVTAINSPGALIQGQYRGLAATGPVHVITGADIVELLIN